MKIGLFGGSFDPVHPEHVRFVRAAIAQLGLERVFVIPSYVAPHKKGGARADGRSRFEMCRIAFRDCPGAEVSDYELERRETSYSYLTCRHFAREFPEAERYFLMGSDMLEDFFTWKEPKEILRCVRIAACNRGDGRARDFCGRFGKEFGCLPVLVDFCGAPLSSTVLRVDLAFGKETELDGEVVRYIGEKGLYSYPVIEKGLSLEKKKRQDHSYRVAKMACVRARRAGVEEEKALLAAALHDCGKYVAADSPLLEGFVSPEGVPSPVLHQYTGAYLAERLLGIRDEEILDAIRFHTSGRANMGELEKLIFLADMLEEERDFPGVETLREIFWRDLDECLYESLRQELEYLQSTGGEIYPLTGQAYVWIRDKINNSFA